LQGQIDDRGLHDFTMRPQLTAIGDDKVIGSSQWLDAEGRRHERFHVLTIRDGKIADMQVCGSWRQAKRFAKRAA
jgi:hypothetical protein